MIFYYTACATFDKYYDEDGMPWKNDPEMGWKTYLERSRLTHLTELVSLDATLNECLVERDNNGQDYWDNVVKDGVIVTNFFTSLDYALREMQLRKRFNLLSVVTEPKEDCKNIKLEDFEFVGYDLLDDHYGHSALSNCGGFDETFLPTELNQFGLIDDCEKAYDIKRRLLENNPEHTHSKTNVIAIWRHKTIGRKS